MKTENNPFLLENVPTVPTVKKPFRIRPYADPARPTLHFIVTFRQAGKRRRKFFSTKKEADAFGQLLKVEFENRGAEGVAFPTALRTMAAECAEMLAPFGKTIRDAATFYAKAQRRSCAGNHGESRLCASDAQ